MDVIQRRRLTDLYANGEEFIPSDNPDVKFWIRKMTPADAEVAYLKASARRSSVLAMEKEEEPSDLYAMIESEVEQLSKESAALWLAQNEVAKKAEMIEAQIAGNEEWEKDRYLVSLQERTLDEDFQTKQTETPDDPEVVRVLGELERFRGQVDEALTQAHQTAEQDFNNDNIEELRKKVARIMLESQADVAWLNEFMRCQVWRCVFWADDREKVFQTRPEVDDIQGELLGKLKAVIDRIHVGDMEGKDLQQTPDSLPPSE